MSNVCLITTSSCLAALLGFGCTFVYGEPQRTPDADAGVMRPGLLAEYRSRSDGAVAVHRVDAKPAFFLGTSSPHPRIPPGPIFALWKGLVQLQDSGPITFSALVGGEVTVVIDGVTVLAGRGDKATSRVVGANKLSRDPGHYAIEIRYQSIEKTPARLQLHWEGPSFAREPIPAWRFRHLPADETPPWKEDERIERGRTLVEELGCARCHRSARPAATPPGPDLTHLRQRVSRDWLMHWLADPRNVKSDAHMPALFATGGRGYAERWLIADSLLGDQAVRPAPESAGDHRAGKLAFTSLGCAACHFSPDLDRAEQMDFQRSPLTGLTDRFRAADLAEFVRNPHGRYPDGRMPRIPVSESEARNIAAFLLLWSPPSKSPNAAAPPQAAIREVLQNLGARDEKAAASALLEQKGCIACHTGLDKQATLDVPIRQPDGGCVAPKAMPRFTLTADDRAALAAFLNVSRHEAHTSGFFDRQRQLAHSGCARCHQRDSDAPSIMESVGSTLGGAFLQSVPFQRTPRLSFPHEKYTRSHLLTAVRDGLPSLRSPRYTYRMPVYGSAAESLLQALAEADGEIPDGKDGIDASVPDPTIGTVHGPLLVGSQGYACVSCHVWNGQLLVSTDPGAVGPDLTRTAGRIRRDWFDRFLDNPLRYHPGTPMPTVFEHGRPAPLRSILQGDAAKQKEALWSYFTLGKNAPSPKPPAPTPIEAPQPGDAAIVAQIPIHLPDGKLIEGICVLTDRHDLIVYDVASFSPIRFYAGGQILRTVQGRVRQFRIGAADEGVDLFVEPAFTLAVNGRTELALEQSLIAFDRLADGLRLTRQAKFASGTVAIEESLQIENGSGKMRLRRKMQFAGIPQGATIALNVPKAVALSAADRVKRLDADARHSPLTIHSDESGKAELTLRYLAPEPRPPVPFDAKIIVDEGAIDGSLQRPGYRATTYPRPKTPAGEDRILPAAVAVHPRDGGVFIASLKTGELFVLRDAEDPKRARFDNYARGLFQDALSMLAEPDGLYVLHRRNLSRLVDRDGDGLAERVERVAALPHGIGDTYDYAYGLARHRRGGFVLSYAPYADAKLAGAGSAIRLVPGTPPEELAFGMRNPLGWCAGPDGEIFFTDNQGEWVAANKLCHLAEGRFYGFPNRAQPQHASKPMGKTTIWVPYAWARSINGVAYDNTGGKFGPFAGQFFLAELMFGGAIIRANVEKINGVYQGACFPFWGKGLLGPVSLAFDRNGPLYVGGITEPGWMSMPDRGALFRINYTGEVPFEIHSIEARPKGFRIRFTRPIAAKSAVDAVSYRVEQYRYEYTGAYGSPEFDRAPMRIERLTLADDRRSVDVLLSALTPDRVYRITAAGVRSEKGETLVHPTGAYTLNSVPKE